MKSYKELELEVLRFSETDLIRTSADLGETLIKDNQGDGLFFGEGGAK